jgi:hypothetical protein
VLHFEEAKNDKNREKKGDALTKFYFYEYESLKRYTGIRLLSSEDVICQAVLNC